MSKDKTVKQKSLLARLLESNLAVSVAVIVLGFLIATIIILLVGRSPSGMYTSLLQVISGWNVQRGIFNSRYIGEWFVSSMPIILCGYSMAFAYRTGLFNIGAEGQYMIGCVIAESCALLRPPFPGQWFLIIILGVAGGAVWGGIVGWFKARFSVSEVVATIMMNYIAQYTGRIITLRLPGATTIRTADFPKQALLASPFLQNLTNGSRLNYGIYFTILAVFVFYFVMERTNLGFSLRATGFNKDAARYVGINTNSSLTASMAFAGAFAGLGGAIVALGAFSYGRVITAQDGYGFDGIAVALVGNNTAWGTVISGLLFGMLKSSQPLMQSRQIPKEIASIIMGLVVVFVSLKAGIQIIAEWRAKRAASTEAGDV
jgi:simple sugar transport system permease protein